MEVVERARSFFAHAGTSYAAFPELAGEGFLKLHREVGEMVMAALPGDSATRVRGSASRGAHLLTRFLATLAPPVDVQRCVHRYVRRVARAEQACSAGEIAAGGAVPPAPPLTPAA